MPQADNSRGGQTRTRKRVRKRQPASRSDAAQRTGANTPPPPRSPAPVQRGHSTERGKTIKPSTVQKISETNPAGRGKPDAAQGNSTREAEARLRGRSDAAQGNRTSAAERFKRTPQYQEAITTARRATIRRKIRRHEPIPPTVNTATKGERLDLRAELEGRGIAARILSDVAREATKKRGKALGGGSVLASAIPFLEYQPEPARELTERGLRDLINAPAQAVPSLYVPAAGVVEAAQGRPARIKQFAKDIDENDPLWNLGAAAVEALQGDPDAAQKRLDRAGKAASEHPGFTGLEVFGAVGTAGRGLGAAGRSRVAPKRVQEAASTERAPKTLPGTSLEEQRTYSKDIFQKAGQVTREKQKARKTRTLRERAAQSDDPREAAELRHRADKTDPTRMQPHEIARRVDERVAANEDVRRIHRARTLSEIDDIIDRVPARQRPLISPIAQGIVRPDADDIRAYLHDLELEHDRLDASGKNANRQLREDLAHALGDPKLDLDAVRDAARAFAEHEDPAQRRLVEQGLLDSDQAEMARLTPYAIRHMDARHDGERLVDAEGQALTADRIRGHMAANGEPDAAFISQAPNQRGAKNFNIRSERAQTINSRRRTGEATRLGTFDTHPDTLREGAARTQGLIDATNGFRGFLDEMVARNSRGNPRGFKNRSQADRAAANLAAETGIQFRPVRINPWGASRDQLARLYDEINSDNQFAGTPGDRSPIVEAIDDALQGKGDGPWALIPEPAARQLQGHLNRMSSTTGGKVFQQMNSAFRKTVLSTSPTWITGNVVEAGVRSTLAKAGPRSYIIGRRTMRQLEQLDPEAAEQLAVRAIGGGHFSYAERQHIRRDAEQYAGTRLEPLANALGKFWRAPGPKQAANAWNRWTELVFQQLNPTVERQFQTAMLGKAIRDANIIPEGVLKTSRQAAAEAARGLRGTNAQVRFGREIDRMYGRYGKLSPGERTLLAMYSPFLMWSLNAAYFVTRTLPMDHPTTLAVIAASENATEDWRKDHGLDLWMKDRVPGFLMGSVPVGSDGAKLRLSRYTPFGLFTDPLHSAAGLWLPQLSGVLDAFEGREWTGEKLRNPDGSPADEATKAKAAAESFLRSTVPVLGQAERVAENGPGALNPFRVSEGRKVARKRRTPTVWTDQADTVGIRWSDQDDGSTAVWSDR